MRNLNYPNSDARSAARHPSNMRMLRLTNKFNDGKMDHESQFRISAEPQGLDFAIACLESLKQRKRSENPAYNVFVLWYVTKAKGPIITITGYRSECNGPCGTGFERTAFVWSSTGWRSADNHKNVLRRWGNSQED